ncbi:glutaredoxin 3 [Mangrovicoccus ximenensis]|uniref:glutaredoxin 3 n=1 Tax=Mangrovicoccus ximenensis TaxID=1911570 RepID=UPI000D3DC210|nr:glutaredoxin 3 [Mangrovicoccus ximenensis]
MPRIDIYTTPTCGYCTRAKKLLKAKRAAFTEIDVSVSPHLRRKMAGRAGGSNSVPQIFIGGTHVGGCSELMALDRSGVLDVMLASS